MYAFAEEMSTSLYGNPHSGSWPSQLSSSRIDDTRAQLLAFFGANSQDYDLVFVANATAGVKLVMEGMRSQLGGYGFIHHQACHTSIVGAREEASWSLCMDNEDVTSWVAGDDRTISSAPATVLFAYSAQSHLDGQRFPLSWSGAVRSKAQGRIYSLLDASSFCATSPLDLGDTSTAPDFTVLSLYKIFGFPDMGALIIRRQARDAFSRRMYFGGGTVDMVVCGKEQWHAPKTSSLHEKLEDGTLPFHSIIAASLAIDRHKKLYNSMDSVRAHTSCLAALLRKHLASLRHANGLPINVTYDDRTHDSQLGRGPVVAFNLRDSRGHWVSLAEFEKLANLKSVYVRTGGMCSPGGIASALDLQPWELKRNFSAGFRCGAEDDVVAGKPTGMIRVSLGPMSTLSDVLKFIDFLEEFFVDKKAPEVQVVSQPTAPEAAMRLRSITVYPIKSCGGYNVPRNTSWDVRPEGLAWDREWCLVHKGSHEVLSQKRYPKMALLKPSIDTASGKLRVRFEGSQDENENATVSVPLSHDPSWFHGDGARQPSRVCGETVATLLYASDKVNNFFSEALGVPCTLARFPAGGKDMASRASKARMQAHQYRFRTQIPGSFPGAPSPPDSDSDSETPGPGNILLSNESPILMVYGPSIDTLNEQISSSGGKEVADSVFRANFVIEDVNNQRRSSSYDEDSWRHLRIGQHCFRLLGACRRCQMVCVNQETGQRGSEPLSTLAKTRRFDGRVFFGCHMRHEPSNEVSEKGTRTASIRTGDVVSVDGLSARRVKASP